MWGLTFVFLPCQLRELTYGKATLKGAKAVQPVSASAATEAADRASLRAVEIPGLPRNRCCTQITSPQFF